MMLRRAMKRGTALRSVAELIRRESVEILILNTPQLAIRKE
jgi:hypothetical protein